MRLWTYIILAGLLSACAGAPWYKAKSTESTASLRVATDLRGNTGLSAQFKFNCKPEPDGSPLGFFHPDADQSYQAERRGFIQKIGMIGIGRFPEHMTAEYKIDTDRGLYIWFDNIGPAGGAIITASGQYLPSTSQSRHVAGFTPKPGESYEAVYSFYGNDRIPKLFKLAQASSGSTTRTEIPFDLGVKSCPD